jgi:hypothetical protein
MTNKTMKVRGLERNLRNPTDTDQLIKGGVLTFENTPQGYKVVKSISTFLTNSNYNRVEISTGVAMDYVARTVRDALADLRGAKGSPTVLSEAVSRADSALRELARPEPLGPGDHRRRQDQPGLSEHHGHSRGRRRARRVRVQPGDPGQLHPDCDPRPALEWIGFGLTGGSAGEGSSELRFRRPFSFALATGRDSTSVPVAKADALMDFFERVQAHGFDQSESPLWQPRRGEAGRQGRGADSVGPHVGRLFARTGVGHR